MPPSAIRGKRRRLEPVEEPALAEAPNYVLQTGWRPTTSSLGSVRDFLKRAEKHNGPWFDMLEKRPVFLRITNPVRGELMSVQDAVTGKRWRCDYQCMRPISEMEVVAWAVS